MKKFAYIILPATCLALSCGQPTRNQPTDTQATGTATTVQAHASPDTTTALAPASPPAIVIEGLELNDGKKWKADAVTSKNVAALSTTIRDIKAEPHKSLDTYHLGTDKLLRDVNRMISQCTMKGPDHEALHHWLHPLMEKIKQLGGTLDQPAAEAAFADIENHVNVYTNYFE